MKALKEMRDASRRAGHIPCVDRGQKSSRSLYIVSVSPPLLRVSLALSGLEVVRRKDNSLDQIS